MLDFNLALELLAVLATLVYLSLIIAENFSVNFESKDDAHLDCYGDKYKLDKRSLYNQQIATRY